MDTMTTPSRPDEYDDLRSKPMTDHAALIKAAKHADWQQVAFNGGPPCFHVDEDGSFCLRAERWDGHKGVIHAFVSLPDLLAASQAREQKALKEAERHLSPENGNRGDLIACIRDLAQVALSNQGLVETYEAREQRVRELATHHPLITYGPDDKPKVQMLPYADGTGKWVAVDELLAALTSEAERPR